MQPDTSTLGDASFYQWHKKKPAMRIMRFSLSNSKFHIHNRVTFRTTKVAGGAAKKFNRLKILK